MSCCRIKIRGGVIAAVDDGIRRRPARGRETVYYRWRAWRVIVRGGKIICHHDEVEEPLDNGEEVYVIYYRAHDVYDALEDGEIMLSSGRGNPVSRSL